jgi:GNAT superfamily N-acetyltransferase
MKIAIDLPDEDVEFLAAMAERLIHQDQSAHGGRTHATADPVYMVQQKARTYGIDPASWDPDGWVIIDENGEEIAEFATEPDTSRLSDGHRLVAFAEEWRLVDGAVALTRRGIEEYLARNGHNLTQPRIWIGSAQRCAETRHLMRVLEHFAQLRKEVAP